MTSPQKTLLIAGFSHGLGSALAQCFEKGGYDVVTVARSGDARYSFDLSDPEATAELFRVMDRDHAPLHAVIHNAMRFHRGSFTLTGPDIFEAVWRACVLSAVNTAQQALPRLKAQRGGHLIFSGATASLKGSAELSAYSSAKFALRGLVDALADGYARDGVRVTHAVIDGLVWTDQTRMRFPGSTAAHAIRPTDLAQWYWQLVHQPISLWVSEASIRPMLQPT